MAKKYKSPTYGLAGKHDGKIDTPDEVDSFLEGFKEDEQLKSLLAKINQDIQTLTAYVNTKASIQQLQELATVVDTKASLTQLQELGALVNTKASVQQLQALSDVVDTKASITQLQQLTGVVNTKADKSLVMFDDVYIGVAASSATVIDSDYHHDSIVRGRPVFFFNANGYLWVVLPSTYDDVVATMNGVEVSMSVDSTTTIGDVEYKVWKSADSYTGSFNILLF